MLVRGGTGAHTAFHGLESPTEEEEEGAGVRTSEEREKYEGAEKEEWAAAKYGHPVWGHWRPRPRNYGYTVLMAAGLPPDQESLLVRKAPPETCGGVGCGEQTCLAAGRGDNNTAGERATRREQTPTQHKAVIVVRYLLLRSWGSGSPVSSRCLDD